jgi:hypothetical protein
MWLRDAAIGPEFSGRAEISSCAVPRAEQRLGATSTGQLPGSTGDFSVHHVSLLRRQAVSVVGFWSDHDRNPLPKQQWGTAWRAMVEIGPIRLVSDDPIYEVQPAHLELLDSRGFSYEVINPRNHRKHKPRHAASD